MHYLINYAATYVEQSGAVTVALPLLYKLCLVGVDVNALSAPVGLSAVHVAAIKPHAEAFIPHLIRLGADTSRCESSKEVVPMHIFSTTVTQTVLDGGQCISGIWDAVRRQDLGDLCSLLRSWSRLRCVLDGHEFSAFCDDSGSSEIAALVGKFLPFNEFLCSAIACDVERLETTFRELSLGLL